VSASRKLCVKLELPGSRRRGNGIKGALRKKASAALSRIREKRDDGQAGFMYLPYDAKIREEIKKAVESLCQEYDCVVSVADSWQGTGLRAMKNMLDRPFRQAERGIKGGKPVFICPERPEDAVLAALGGGLDLKRTVFCVSSGLVPERETLAAVKQLLKKVSSVCGRNRCARHFIFMAEKENAVMRAFSQRYGVPFIATPSNSRGPFCVLSAACLLPLAAVGYDIAEILRGASQMDSACMKENMYGNPALLASASIYRALLSGRKKGVMVSAASDHMTALAVWFSRLIGSALYGNVRYVLAAEYGSVNVAKSALGSDLFLFLEDEQNGREIKKEGGKAHSSFMFRIIDRDEYSAGQAVYALQASASMLAELSGRNIFDTERFKTPNHK